MQEATIHSQIQTRRITRGASIYTARQIADLTGLNLGAIYRGSNSGQIPCIRLQGMRRFVWPKAAIDAWLATAGGSVDLRDAK